MDHESHSPTGFHLMIAFNSAVSCSSVHGSVMRSYSSGSGLTALEVEPGVLTLDAAVSWGVVECVRLAFFLGGMVD